jgi:hypothetical protein
LRLTTNDFQQNTRSSILGARGFLIFIGYCVSKLEFDKSKYIKYLNEKNDGIYIYYAKFGGEEHEIKINTKNKTIELKSGKIPPH